MPITLRCDSCPNECRVTALRENGRPIAPEGWWVQGTDPYIVACSEGCMVAAQRPAMERNETS